MNVDEATAKMLAKIAAITAKYEQPSRSCKEDCHWYEEWQDMNASIPSCKKKHLNAIGPNDCEDCPHYATNGQHEHDRALFVTVVNMAIAHDDLSSKDMVDIMKIVNNAGRKAAENKWDLKVGEAFQFTVDK